MSDANSILSMYLGSYIKFEYSLHLGDLLFKEVHEGVVDIVFFELSGDVKFSVGGDCYSFNHIVILS